ncbi:hypothetical protein B0A55_03761 [Friedmanniomyces simplex]|uniref:DNA-directed DNA polymerase n=1 Tax=Friedmanniomyces simplex TaxID=329884 RepID=A0A4U0XDM2_9PEZI|nr:hypothetical protein B0A55_03761 [Friedmanniomyces simplex]
MADSTLPSLQTLQNDSQATESPEPLQLNLSHLPPIFVSATHFESDDLHELEDELAAAGATLTYAIHEARIVLTKALQKKRIAFDLRAKGLWTEEVKPRDARPHTWDEGTDGANDERPTKKRRLDAKETWAHEVGKTQAQAIVIDDGDTESDVEAVECEKSAAKAAARSGGMSFKAAETPSTPLDDEDTIRVIKVNWFEDSQKSGHPLPLDQYVTYQARPTPKPAGEATPEPAASLRRTAKAVTTTTLTTKAAFPSLDHDSRHILERAREDAGSTSQSRDHLGRRNFHHAGPSAKAASWAAGHGKGQKEYAHLLHATTTEEETGYSSEMPEMPDWVKQGIKYACQRSTPANSPNSAFADQLKKIQLARTLTNDEIGVRAYSTSIASLSAYPYNLSSPREILALPGCDAKIANLFVEYSNTGKIQAVEDLEADEDMKIMRLFYEIWGVGATTAREFYYDRGWKQLDDIVDYGWSTLSRVQQIGVKYYDEFLDPIPRKEVEEIGAIIHRHAVKVRDSGVQSLIVGGYRRGKQACGDVDMIVSHPDESQTLNIVNDVVASLEDEGWITHTLLLSLHNSKRKQETLPYKSREGPSGSHGGFDTLDKALVVWQDPLWPTKAADEACARETGGKLRNPNIHRRVDIIIAPWRTVGCAVTGWSGGTTFQRDLRRYAKNTRSWKFDSSGIRDRANGEVVDVEGYCEYKGAIGKGRAKDMVEAEKRVFEGMGLVNMASAVIKPDPDEQPPSANGLKRRQSEAVAAEEQESKRQRTSPGKSSPTAAVKIEAEDVKQDSSEKRDTPAHEAKSTESIKPDPESESNEPPNTLSDAKEKEPLRRMSVGTDEKQRTKRLFGALLGNLNQPSDRTSKRRLEIEARKKAELKRQDDERHEDKQRRLEELAKHRGKVQKRVDGEGMRIRHAQILNMANFLETSSEPKLHYRPWDLRPDEEDRIDQQIKEAEILVAKEVAEFKGPPVTAAEAVNKDGNGSPARTPTAPIDGQADVLPQTDDPPNGTTTAEDKKEPENDDEPAKAEDIEAAQSAEQGAEKEKEVQDHPAEITNGDQPPAEVVESKGAKVEPDDAEKVIVPDAIANAEEQKQEDDDGDHVVEGDEDTVIY